MAIYGGFDPATFQAWSLNLLADVFVSPGIARGFQVTQATIPGMLVYVTVDSVAFDAVCYFSSGAWMRVDAQTQFGISANTSGATRTDALVAQVDPYNAGNLSLSVQANWSQGFNPTNANQLVIALISVANNATSIVNANITMTSKVAQVTGAGGSTSLTASDGVGLTPQDNSAASTLTLAMTGLPAGVGRNLVLQTTDASSIGHTFTFQNDYSILGGKGAKLNIGTSAYGDIVLQPGSSNVVYLYSSDGSGTSTQVRSDGFLYRSNGSSYLLGNSNGGGAFGRYIWEGNVDPGANAAEGDIWISG